MILIFAGVILIGLGILFKINNKKNDTDRGNFLPYICCWFGFIIILFVLISSNAEEETTDYYSYVYISDRSGNKVFEYHERCYLDLTNKDKYVVIISEDGKRIKVSTEDRIICVVKETKFTKQGEE